MTYRTIEIISIQRPADRSVNNYYKYFIISFIQNAVLSVLFIFSYDFPRTAIAIIIAENALLHLLMKYNMRRSSFWRNEIRRVSTARHL